MDVSIKLFSDSFDPLLARNPSDATGRMQQHGYRYLVFTRVHWEINKIHLSIPPYRPNVYYSMQIMLKQPKTKPHNVRYRPMRLHSLSIVCKPNSVCCRPTIQAQPSQNRAELYSRRLLLTAFSVNGNAVHTRQISVDGED